MTVIIFKEILKMENKNNNTESTVKKEVFEEPTCELVSFSFENVLADYPSNPYEIEFPYDTF